MRSLEWLLLNGMMKRSRDDDGGKLYNEITTILICVQVDTYKTFKDVKLAKASSAISLIWLRFINLKNNTY